MAAQIDWFVRRACLLAGLAYASRMKRLGHWHYIGIVAAVLNSSEESEVAFGGSMPRTVTTASMATAMPGSAVDGDVGVIE